MKTTWTVTSFLAVAHLLTILMFVGWLWQSGRLSAERMEALRELFAPTVEEAERLAAEAEAEAEAERRAALEQALRERPPFSSEVQVRRIAALEEAESRALRHLEQEKDLLRRQIEATAEALEQREAELEDRKRAWEQMIEAEQQRRADEQFAKTVRQYESVPPRQAKNMLMGLIDADGLDQAVAYLDAMNARAASKILQEFRTDAEVQLATELLERLRRFGFAADDQRNPTDADRLANAP